MYNPRFDLLKVMSLSFPLESKLDNSLSVGIHLHDFYLDGIAFFERDGRTFIQSHHGPEAELTI